MSIIKTARRLRKDDTWAERLLWRWLRDRRFAGYKFRRQHPFAPYILDFFCPEAMLDIELDGSGHTRPDHRHWDEELDKFLAAQGIKVLRFPNSSLRRNRKLVERKIGETLYERAPKPPDPELESSIPPQPTKRPADTNWSQVKRKAGDGVPSP